MKEIGELQAKDNRALRVSFGSNHPTTKMVFSLSRRWGLEERDIVELAVKAMYMSMIERMERNEQSAV